MPVEFQIPSLRIQVKERMTEETSEKIRLQQLLTLSETRVQSLAILELDQQRRRAFVDRPYSCSRHVWGRCQESFLVDGALLDKGRRKWDVRVGDLSRQNFA